MKILRKILLAILLPLTMAGVTGCVDDLLNPDMWGDIPEGETVVSASVQFRPFTESLSDTRSAGDAIRDVENLCILVYTTGENPEFVRSFYITKSEKQYDATFTEPERDELKDLDPAEKTTARVNFSVPLPYGRYHILAVANMGDITKYYSEEVYGNMDAVRKIQLTWDEENVGANNQMFGFFTNADAVTYEPVGTELEDPVNPEIVTVNKPGISLQAWIKRAASKVTVAYDGSGLADNVRIYIQSVQIRDIPKSCILGMPSAVTATKGESMAALYADRLIKEGEKYVYNASDKGFVAGDINVGGTVLNSGLYLTNGPANCQRGSDHSEDDPHSLYFYENNQGKGPVKWQDKSSSDANHNNQVSYPGSINESHEYFKDSMRGGTFIEVKAFYHSDNAGRPGSGAITYRFMLGQNTDRDYSALRNCHYKLTLKFKGYANDIDWHIEYVEPDPSITVRSPQYVSYLYNRTAHINVKISGEIADGEKLHAVITENHWYPSDASGDVYVTAAEKHINNGLKAPAGATDGDENGFLSLYRPHYAVIGFGQGTTSNYNYNYYFGNGTNPVGTPLYKRDYDTGISRHIYNGDSKDWHEVSEIIDADGSKSRVFSIPLYTRARSLSESRGHTGNNIFAAHIRQASVTLSIRMKNGVLLERTVDVRQVRRIENPKAIWRSEKCVDPFDVILRYPRVEGGNDYEDLLSDGPWYAEKVSDGQVDASWYSITPLGDSRTDGDRVAGSDSTRIHFRFQPNSQNTSGTPRCGVIRIYYNNYTCVHLIFVRQGYQPLAMRDGEVEWHTCNVTGIEDANGKRSYKEANDPRDEGSMFRWGSTKGITAAFSREHGWGEDIGQSLWDEYKGTTSGAWADDDDTGARLPRLHDFMKLFCDQDKNLNTDIEYGFGVLYGDGAKETAPTVTDANCYYSDRSTTTRGMRGCIVYNHTNGRQLFFPIGASGYGRRKEGYNVGTNDTRGEYGKTGVLRYANRFKEYPAGNELNSRPLFRDLYMQEGAIYWFKELWIKGSGDENKQPYGYSDLDGYNQSAWDVNYKTLNFKFFSSNAWAGGTDCSRSDACFIRLVSDPKSSSKAARKRAKKNGKRR